jgi:transposase-like protein
MDQIVMAFRERARRENRGRRGIRRRYSDALQREAVAHCQRRQDEGIGLRAVAGELGIAPWSLQRWMAHTRSHGGFQAVAVVETAAVGPAADVVVITPQGFRVEGLDVAGAVQLLTGLR